MKKTTETPLVTLITGTSRGIGKELALHYLAAGHQVIGCSRGAATIEDPGYHHYQVDLASVDAIRGMLEEIGRRWGRISHLINNAAISSFNLAAFTEPATVERILAVNFTAPYVLCQEALRLMQKQRFGRIVNFSTVAVPLAVQTLSAYASSKAAIETLTRILAREFGPFGITVNCLGPTAIQTDLISQLPENVVRDVIAAQAVKARAGFEDVIAATDFFLSPRCGQITGQVLYLGGFG